MADNVRYLPLVVGLDASVPTCMDCKSFGITNGGVGFCLALAEEIDDDIARTCPDYEKGD